MQSSAARQVQGPTPPTLLDADAHPHAGRRVVHRREPDVRPEIGLGELLEELGRPAFLDRSGSVDDDVLAHSGVVDLGAFEGDHDSRVAADVLELLLIRD